MNRYAQQLKTSDNTQKNSRMMPEILKRLISQLMERGMSRDRAGAIATKQLQKQGILNPGTLQLTEHGKTRDAMSASERAKDRAGRGSGRTPDEFDYNPSTNRATLKDTRIVPKDFMNMRIKGL